MRKSGDMMAGDEGRNSSFSRDGKETRLKTE